VVKLEEPIEKGVENTLWEYDYVLGKLVKKTVGEEEKEQD
jgi:hypothetical protein